MKDVGRYSFWLTACVWGLCVWTGLPAGVSANPPAPLRWGGDQEGGGPYIYPRDDDPTLVTGFEVELAGALGRELQRPAKFVQGNWDQLLLSLDRGDIDLVLNGYEYMPERASRYLASIPYYVYELGLCTRKGSPAKSWEALRNPPPGKKYRVGVLGAAASDRYLSEHFAETCEILRFEGSAEALRLVQTGQIDATVQDLPILQFFVGHLQRFPDLEIVDQPAAPGYYVAYARAGDTQLIEQVNTAIRALYSSGKLRSIYERYELWNEAQTGLPEIWQSWRGGLVSLPTHKLWTLLEQFPLLCRAACVTVALSLLSMPLAVGIGLLLTLVRCWNTRVLGGSPTHATWIWQMLRSLATLYIEVVRGTPLAFQLFVVYFVLPQLGVTISAFWSGVLALAVNYSAYEAEILRLGLQAIPRGQMEAALSLGMTRPLAVRRIILPQAVRIALPATANDFIALFKDTAVCSVIAVEELSKQYSMGAKSTGLFLEMALLASLLYLLMSYPLSRLARWLEQKLNPGHDPQ